MRSSPSRTRRRRVPWLRVHAEPPSPTWPNQRGPITMAQTWAWWLDEAGRSEDTPSPSDVVRMRCATRLRHAMPKQCACTARVHHSTRDHEAIALTALERRQQCRSAQALGCLDGAAVTQQDMEHVRQTMYKVCD